MNGAGFILAINLCVAGLLACAFAAIAAYDKRRAAARWFTGAYTIGMGYFVVLALMPLVGGARPAVVVEFTAFLAAAAAFNVGIARQYGVTPPWRLMATVFVLSTAAVWLSQDMPRQSFMRVMAYQAPYSVMLAIAVWLVLSAHGRRHIDTVLAALLAASALQFLCKPLLAQALGGWGSSPSTYLDSAYAMVSQTMGTVFALAVALMVLLILVQDLLSDMSEKSETDTLSQLLNRRGFERHAARAIERSAEQGLPLALVMADLDSFKSVNDTYGHAIGDRAIVAFAACLRDHLMPQQCAARIGGEEFAVLLPAAEITTARLFAESVRVAFSTASVDGLPPEARLTASFGVAELQPQEDCPALMRRADAALYSAKHNGRDRVGLAEANLLLFHATRQGRPEPLPRTAESGIVDNG